LKQLIQYFRTGETEIIESPVPTAGAKNLIIESKCSLISVGTEKMLLNFGKASIFNKAKQQPDKVIQVINKIKTEGLLSTVEAVWTKLNDPIPLGYSNVGEIVETGSLVTDFKQGNRVVSNGPHAEFVSAPWTLAAKIPEIVDDESAAFTVLGSIAMQGWRLMNPTLGETIVVVGLGLLGQLTLQIARANGCRVIGIDIDNDKIEQAKKLGLRAVKSADLEENVSYIHQLTKGIGADGVIITASTSSEEILSQSSMMCRQRGKIVLVGVVPITVPRNLFYEKELSFQVSSSYGPGRYDPIYEQKGIDYPLPFVRWTAKRNMESFLFLLEQNKVDVKSLISHRFKFEKIREVYNTLDSINPLGVIIEYEETKDNSKKLNIKDTANKIFRNKDKPVVGFIGVGNFAKMVMLPALKDANANIKTIASLEGYSAAIAANKNDIEVISSDAMHVFDDPEINTVFITTPHSSHASLVLQGLNSDKNVFVEKPLALTFDDLREISKVINNKQNLNLMVGFNRRFAPTIQKTKKRLENRIDPISVIITVNSGAIPMDHWVHDLETGGGRILGEGCHFIDLARYLIDSEIDMVAAISTQNHSGTDEDKVMITLSFKDGSHASINYLANGNKSFPKERIEVFSSEKVYVIDNFKSLKSYGDSLKSKGIKQDKGHYQEVKAFLQNVQDGKSSPIPIEQIFEIHLATLAVNKSIANKKFVNMAVLWEKLQS
jgi:predicted dehydrogenase/threonine dehydrogenase-like Zn-dependent dehydrogenase